MLTLTNPLDIEGYTVYRDDANEIAAIDSAIDALLAHDHVTAPVAGGGGTPATPLTGTAPSAGGIDRFHVLPIEPTLATDADGKPIFSLIVYRRDEARIDPDKKDDVGGGILTFTVELSVPDDKLRKINAKLRAMVYGADDSDTSHAVDASIVEFVDGKVSVQVAAETPGVDTNMFVKGAVGTGKVSGVGGSRKAVMVALSQDGAALLSQLEKLRVLPINVQYDLTFEHRLLGVRMRVWCDVRSSYHLVQTHSTATTGETGGYLDTGLGSHDITAEKINSVTETIVRSKLGGVQVIPESSEVTSDTIDALQKFGMDMLAKAMEKPLEAVPPPASVDRSYLEKWFSDSTDQLNFELDRRMVLTRGYDPSANLRNVLNRSDIAELVTYVDLRIAFFALLKVPIRVNADFQKLLISHVVVTVSYASRRANGTPTTETRSFDFTDGGQLQTFVCFANSLDAVAYDYTVTVHYKDSGDPYVFTRTGAKETFLVVDVGVLGVLSVDVGLGLVDLDKFPAATVTLRPVTRSGGTGEPEHTFKLEKEHPAAVWTALIRAPSSGGYQYKADWLRKEDGEILEGEWRDSRSDSLKIDAPVPAHLSVAVVATGNFRDGPEPLSHVLVSLRYRDPANHYEQEGRLDFTDEKQLLTWTVDLRDPDLREYEYRYDMVYKGGLVKHVPEDGTSFLPGEPGFITVGERFTVEVNLYPFLLTFDDKLKGVQVDMRYEDADRNINRAGSFVFNKDAAVPRVWRAAGDPTGPRTWMADIIYFKGNDVVKVPTSSSDGDTLIIPPPPAPAGGTATPSR